MPLIMYRELPQARRVDLEDAPDDIPNLVFVIARHALACKVDCKREVGCETDLRAVRDGFS